MGAGNLTYNAWLKATLREKCYLMSPLMQKDLGFDTKLNQNVNLSTIKDTVLSVYACEGYPHYQL